MASVMILKLRPIHIRWTDSVMLDEWSEGDELPKLAKADTMGFLIAEHADRYIVGLERFDTGEWRHVSVIPKSMVTYVYTLDPLKTHDDPVAT